MKSMLRKLRVMRVTTLMGGFNSHAARFVDSEVEGQEERLFPDFNSLHVVVKRAAAHQNYPFSVVVCTKRVNPVEVIYAAFPAFLYLNATLAGLLLVPLLEFQSSSLYTQPYAAPDLGSNWPNVSGNNVDSSFAIDNSGAMLIMALAHAQKSGDGSLLLIYYDLLRMWADFLVTKIPQSNGYMTADGVLGATSNLVLKGIMGIYAMSQINQILETRGTNSSQTSHYLDTARKFAQQWQNSVLTSDHVLSTYGNNASWGLLYNLYAPRLLGADIISQQVYELQAGWYSYQSTKALSSQLYGLPYESSESMIVKAHWSLFSAGSIANASVSDGRDALLNLVHARAFMKTGTQNDYATNPSTYNAINGSVMTGTASPVMGAVFALLALNLPKGSAGLSTDQVSTIVGAVVGSVAGIGVVVLLVFLYLRRRKRGKSREAVIKESDGRRHNDPMHITPFISKSNEQDRLAGGAVGQHEESGISSSPTVQRPEHQVPNRSVGFSPIGMTNARPASVVESMSSATGSIRRHTKTSPQEDDLGREVEQLRMVVEMLRREQTQVVYQDMRNAPNEPPPRYSPPGSS